jgi:hypothetical protein
MALRTRRRSTCRRTTSSGSVTVIATASHVTTKMSNAMSGMWTARGVTSVGMPVATWQFQPLFPRQGVLGVPGPGRPGVSALPDPAEQGLRRGLRRRLMLAVAPGTAGAVLMVALPARDADHAPYCAAFSGCSLRAQQKRPRPCYRCSRSACGCSRLVQTQIRLVRAGPQAAFARRIRRRRSAERSSSFRPPHVPYFSGRETA